MLEINVKITIGLVLNRETIETILPADERLPILDGNWASPRAAKISILASILEWIERKIDGIYYDTS